MSLGAFPRPSPVRGRPHRRVRARAPEPKKPYILHVFYVVVPEPPDRLKTYKVSAHTREIARDSYKATGLPMYTVMTPQELRDWDNDLWLEARKEKAHLLKRPQRKKSVKKARRLRPVYKAQLSLNLPIMPAAIRKRWNALATRR